MQNCATKTALIVVNPKAGANYRQAAVAELATDLAHYSINIELKQSLDGLAEESAKRLARGDLAAVVAAGGDGTVAEVVNRCPQNCPIAILPLGTENLLSKYLQIDCNPLALAQIIAAGETAWLDAGSANGRLFLLMAGIGFDAEVVRLLHARRSGNIRHCSYVKPILRTIRKYRYPELRVWCAPQADGVSSVIPCRWAFVFNVPRYGFGLRFAPRGSSTDGMLDLCTFSRGGLCRSLRYLLAVIRGTHQRLPDYVGLQARHIRIESDVEVPYEIDGDPGGNLPLDIEIVPRRVRMLVAKDWSDAAR